MTNRPLLTVALLGLLVSGTSAGSEHVVIQKDKQFSETELTVQSEDTIVFKNDDPVVHNIFSNSEVLTFNATQDPGDETKVAANTKGTFLVRCAIHPKMKLSVRVEGCFPVTPGRRPVWRAKSPWAKKANPRCLDRKRRPVTGRQASLSGNSPSSPSCTGSSCPAF